MLPPICWYKVLRGWQALGTGYPASIPSLVDSGFLLRALIAER